MRQLRRNSRARVGYQFVSSSYLPDGADEYHVRNRQNPPAGHAWRSLSREELQALAEGGNVSDNWSDVLVEDPFLPERVRNCEFHGLVRIGPMSDACLTVDGLVLPVGLAGSTIISCDLGRDVCVRDVKHLAHCIVGDECAVTNVGEMYTRPRGHFGMGVIRDGQDEQDRIWLELANENGGRGVLAFPGMRCADAALWASRRGDRDLMDRLRDITQHQFGSMRGTYSQLGERTTVRNGDSIVDVRIGPDARIVNVTRLEGVTIESSRAEPTEVADGVELVDAILHRGCRVTGGVKAHRVVLGQQATLSKGARVADVYLGDNSTISCCEVLCSLIFPAHEQHHNNSFLIAATVQGQSNIAAGATIGSNHNSRAPDGEIVARRGFWPGLCVSLKHNSRFAAYTLIAKGAYPAELDIPLPFSLVSNDAARDRLMIMPAYWWMYNMYALARNSWKFQARDKRSAPGQKVEFRALAPDTAEEIARGMDLLALWAGKARLRDSELNPSEHERDQIVRLGRELLGGADDEADDFRVLAEDVENSRRECIVLKPHAAYRAYRQMLLVYAAEALVEYMTANPEADLETMCDELSGPRQRDWVNLGGQPVWAGDLDQLVAEIRTGRHRSWDDIHAACDRLWAKYGEDRQAHGLSILLEVLEVEALDDEQWRELLTEAVELKRRMAEATARSRGKDYTGHFRQMTFADADEMRAVVGCAQEDAFCRQMKTEAEDFAARAQEILRRS